MIRRWRTALLVALALTTSGCGYNRIQELDEQANNAQANIETQLQRRSDLIGNLVNTVKGYASQEERIFTEIARARGALAGARQSGDPEQLAAADAQLSGALSRLLVITENYPQLKSDALFRGLMDELAGTENRIATARQDYNQAVTAYNAYIRKFPAVVTAKVTGAQPRKQYRADPAANTAPTVDFSTPQAPAKSP